MSRCLSQLLIKYQTEEEAEILAIANKLDEPEKNRVLELYEPSKITADDLSREYSPADVKQLCLRTKVRVNMTFFNCLWDAKKRFDKKGRLENRSERFVNEMLKKAVRKKMVFPYSPERVAKCNHIRQCQLKKDNNARLDRWSMEFRQSPVVEHSYAIEPSLLMAQPSNEILGNRNTETVNNIIIYPSSVAAETQESSIGMPESELEIWIDTAEDDEEIEDANVSKDSREQIIVEDNADWVEAAININSQSVDILNGDLQTPQSESQPEDYNVFGTQVPCTSTQSQGTEPFLVG
ncbi:telomere-binding protein cav isoform X1 [Drosophila innubila]|uniref:telomere-binding protein cav isoform X1 n=1 Tax=Drosophila innubila TaxID=198719 RepID=UPI00148E34C7|nr:telomere-binding protein cav isoform X1 [Drosophila innubila]